MRMNFKILKPVAGEGRVPGGAHLDTAPGVRPSPGAAPSIRRQVLASSEPLRVPPCCARGRAHSESNTVSRHALPKVRRGCALSAAGAGFTLVEILIAIGLLGL